LKRPSKVARTERALEDRKRKNLVESKWRFMSKPADPDSHKRLTCTLNSGKIYAEFQKPPEVRFSGSVKKLGGGGRLQKGESKTGRPAARRPNAPFG